MFWVFWAQLEGRAWAACGDPGENLSVWKVLGSSKCKRGIEQSLDSLLYCPLVAKVVLD